MKTIDEIYQDMRSLFALETGVQLSDSGEMAVRLHTLATEIYGLYVQNQWTLTQCFPQTATGSHLDYHAQLRGLARNAATSAQGVLRFSLAEKKTEAMVIPAGTVCMTAALTAFETTEAATISAGTLSVDVPAAALLPGSSGNVAAGTVRTMSAAPVGISSCTNPAAFSGGAAEEGDEPLRIRVLDSFLRMPNGANAAYYEREAYRTPEVAAVNVLGRNRGAGTVDVVIAEVGGAPSAETLAAVSAHLTALREIAVDLKVLSPTLANCNVRVAVQVAPGRVAADVREAVGQALRNYFDGRLLGKPILRAELGRLIFAMDGVSNYSIVTPATDLAAVPGTLYRLGTLTVEGM